MKRPRFEKPDHTASIQMRKTREIAVQNFTAELQTLSVATSREQVIARQNEMNQEVFEMDQRIADQQQAEVQAMMNGMGQDGWRFVDTTDFFTMDCCVHYIFAHQGKPCEHMLVGLREIANKCLEKRQEWQSEFQRRAASFVVQEQFENLRTEAHDSLLALELRLRDELILQKETDGWEFAGVIYQSWYVFTREL